VSTLDFLSLDQAQETDRFRPLMRSSMERALREAGAAFEERDGWLVATHVPGQEKRSLAVRDVTHLHRVRESAEGVLIEFSGGEGRAPVVVGRVWGGEGDRPPEETPDVTAGYAALQIEGPGAATVLRRISEMPLDTLPAAGAVAHIRAWVIRDGGDSYRLLCAQEYGHYLWEVVVDAAERLGGGPAACMRGSTPSSTPPTRKRRRST
jgi:glycine cleavage system aminomethyltransferase T